MYKGKESEHSRADFLKNEKILMEYELEKARELARADAIIEFKNVRRKNLILLQDKFIFSGAPYIILTCLTIIVTVLTR